MDMTQFNESIKNAEEEVSSTRDGPRYPNGKYLLSVRLSEEKHGDHAMTADGHWPQIGLWVTFVICEGEHKGKEYKEYYGLKHPTSTWVVKYGMANLKKLYRAINFFPAEFDHCIGKRFIATLESKKNPPGSDYDYDTNIKKYDPAPKVHGDTFADVVAPTPTPKNDIGNKAPTSWTAPNGNKDEIPF